MFRTSLIVAGLALAALPSRLHAATPAEAKATRGHPVEAVLLRLDAIDAAALLDGLQLRSPQRELAVSPWPAAPARRFALFAVATVRHDGETIEITVVLSDGRAYYRTLEASAEGAPRLAASTIANLLAAIEEDELPPDEEDVPLPPEEEPAAAIEPVAPPVAPSVVVEPRPPPPERPRSSRVELEPIVAAACAVALGPPPPGGFAGGGGGVGLELRWPAGAVLSAGFRSHWFRPGRLTVGRSRVSLGGGYAWRRGRFELRTVLALDLEPWGVRRDGERQSVAYPGGERRGRGLGLGGHLRVVPALRVTLRDGLTLRFGPRVELAGSGLAQAAGVARLVVVTDGERRVEARVGGLELTAGVELGVSWALPRDRSPR